MLAQLHSRYNPQAEAVRYIDSLNLKKTTECFILIEPGEGYLIPVLQEKYINSKIIVLHVDNSFSTNDPSNTAALHTTETAALQKFLEKEIPDIETSLISIIEWRPSLNYYKEAYLKLLSAVVEFIKRLDAGKRTTAVFGKRWVRNFFKNLNNINQTLLYSTSGIPVIITGSGPSLEASLPVIRKLQDKCLIIAASSSITALAHNGISVDIIIATDGGYWALRHIYPFYRNAAASVLAVNLCAALPSQSANTPKLIINDGSFWQNIVLRELSIASVIIPQRGTVTASAVDLAVILSTGNIYLAGMDLCVKDIRTHARPYGFDHLIFNRACRFTPVYSESFIRASLIKNGGSMDIYASWFRNQLVLWPKRIYSLGENRNFESAVPLKPLQEKNTHKYFRIADVKNNSADFQKRGVSALLAALKDSRYAVNIKTELIPLLFPNEKNVTDCQLNNAINTICETTETACE